jgi:hypothetical protein
MSEIRVDKISNQAGNGSPQFTGSISASGFSVPGQSGFLKADGTVDNNTYSGIGGIGAGILTLGTSGTGLSVSANPSFGANDSNNKSITFTLSSTSSNTASTLVARDSSGNFSAGTISASTVNATTLSASSVYIGGSSGPGRIWYDAPNLQVKYVGYNNITHMMANFAGSVNFYNTETQDNLGSVWGVIGARGFKCRAGIDATTYGTNQFQLFWTGSGMQLWVDAASLGIISTSSDYRIKENIVPLSNDAIDRIKQLKPVSYQRKQFDIRDDETRSNSEYCCEHLFQSEDFIREGFIAHEVAEVIPSAVNGDKDSLTEIQSLNVDAIVSVLTKALQEAVERIESLESEIQTLKSQIS